MAGTTLSYKKISPVRLNDLRGPRRKKPPVRAIQRKRTEVIEKERAIVGSLLSDRAQRIAYCHSLGMQPDGFLVSYVRFRPHRGAYED